MSDDPWAGVRNHTTHAWPDAVLNAIHNGGHTVKEIADLACESRRDVLTTLNHLRVDEDEIETDGVHVHALPSFVRRIVPNNAEGEAMAARWELA